MPPPQGELQTLYHSSELSLTHVHENVTQLSHKCDPKDTNRKKLIKFIDSIIKDYLDPLLAFSADGVIATEALTSVNVGNLEQKLTKGTKGPMTGVLAFSLRPLLCG
jgi:hypothetical protein